MAPSKFYEEVDFCNRDLSCKNICRFFKILKQGVQPTENKVAQMSCLTVLAFVDQASIVTEAQKHVDQLAVLDNDGKKQVLSLQHKTLLGSEEKTYQFYQQEKFANIETLKALGLAAMQTKNPKVTDTREQLQEIFLMDQLPQQAGMV